jgi:microcystin-dependent protein
VGSTGGEETHTLTGAESGTSVHSHTMFDQSGAGGANGSGARFVAVTINANTTGAVGTDASTAANASSAHNIMQPSAVVYKIIKY